MVDEEKVREWSKVSMEKKKKKVIYIYNDNVLMGHLRIGWETRLVI